MRIQSVKAFSVNLMDQAGERLMTEKEVQAIIDNELGLVVDKINGKIMINPGERLVLHSLLMESLPALSAVYDKVQNFNEARRDGESS